MIPDPLAAGAPYPLHQSITLVPLPDDLPDYPQPWGGGFLDPAGWLNQWPFGLVRQLWEALWNFVKRPISAIGTGVAFIFRDIFRAVYTWERSLFYDQLPAGAGMSYPEPADWMSTNDFVAYAFRLPFHALWGIVDKVPGQVGALPFVSDIGTLLARIPTGLGDTLTRIITAVTVDLPSTLGGLATSLTSIITAVTVDLPSTLGGLATSLTSIITAVTVHLPSTLSGLATSLTSIITAVTVDLPRTLGGLAQAVADRVGPLITAAIAGLGDLPARVQELLKPLLDTIGSALDTFRTDAINRLSGLATTLASVVTAVAISIPNAVASIIPTITATLTTLRTTLLLQIQAVGSYLGTSIATLGTTLGTTLGGVQTFLGAAIADFRRVIGALLDSLDAFVRTKLATIHSLLDQLPSDLPDLVLGRLRTTLDSIISRLTDLPQGVWGLISPRLDDLRISLVAIPGQVTAFIGPRLDDLRAAVTTIPDQVGPVVSPFFDSLRQRLDTDRQTLESAIHGDFGQVIKSISGGQDLLETAWGEMAKAFTSVGKVATTPWITYAEPLLDLPATAIDRLPAGFDPGQLPGQLPVPFASVARLFTSLMNYAGRWLDFGVTGLLAHFKGLGYMSPTTAVDSLPRIQTIVREMAVGLGSFALTAQTFGFWKNIGMGQISAMLWNMTNFSLITGAVMGALSWSALTWPLRYYFNDQFRPMMPPLPDVSMMYAKHEIDDTTFERWLGFYGFHPDIVDVYKRYIFRDPRLFEIVRLAEIAAPPITPPPEVVTWLARLKVQIKDPADWWYYYKFGKAGYEDVDIEVLVQVAKMAVARREQTAYFMQTRRLFRDGFITTARARELLEEGWVPEEPIGFRLKAMALERDYELLSDKRSIILQAMARGLATDGEAYSGLLDLGMDSERAALAIMGRRLGLLPIAREVPPEPLPGGGGFGEE